MVNNLPNQPESINYNQFTTFSEGVKYYLKLKNMTQAGLSRASLLSKTIISRICRDSNDKGSTYVPTSSVVIAVSIGLGLNIPEAEELLYAAFPERAYWPIFLENGTTTDEATEILYENGLPLLGNIKE